MEPTYSITKSTVECYKIRHAKSCYWADITVDHNGGKGRISIASDFGDYQYYWGACGDSFKEFLTKIGIDYAADKFKADRWFDHARTIKHYKEQILEYRRIDHLKPDHARKMYNQIKELEEGFESLESFHMSIADMPELMAFHNHCPDVCYSITPQFRNLWKEIWPVFIDELKNEMVTA